MAPASTCLSFSLLPFDMLRSCESQMLSSAESSHQHCFFEPFDGSEWPNLKPPQMPYAEENKDEKDMKAYATIPVPASFNPQIQQQIVPKLEDFLSGRGHSEMRYSDRQTEMQESSLSNAYEQGCRILLSDHEPIKVITAATETGGLQAFPAANSGVSEVIQDSVSVNGIPFACSDFQAQSVHSPLDRGPQALTFAFSRSASERAVVPADLESSKKMTDTFGQRTSVYRGVTKHRWTGRYEAHLWDNSCRREGQTRKGRQVYLGGYDREEKAARAYDLAALKYWGPAATTNFPVSCYTKELEDMKSMARQEFIASLRRKSSGFSRGASIYRGVTRHHQQGRWQARIGRVAGNKDLYLGTFGTEEEAAEAYDVAAIKFRGVNAVTNFEMSRYNVEAIAHSTLPIGGVAKRLKLSLEASASPVETTLEMDHDRDREPPLALPSCGNSSCVHIPVPATCGLPFSTAMPAAFHRKISMPHLLQLQSNNDGSFSDSSPNFVAPAAAMLRPAAAASSEFCGCSLLYGLTTPINSSSNFNALTSNSRAIVGHHQQWHVASTDSHLF